MLTKGPDHKFSLPETPGSTSVLMAYTSQGEEELSSLAVGHDTLDLARCLMKYPFIHYTCSQLYGHQSYMRVKCSISLSLNRDLFIDYNIEVIAHNCVQEFGRQGPLPGSESDRKRQSKEK